MRHATILAAILVLVLCVGCSTSGQGSKAAPATGTTGVGAQNVGDTQAGQTNVLMGGDVTYNIDTAGRKDVPDDVKAKLVSGMDRYLDAIEKAESDEARMAILDGMTKYADAMGRAFGVVINISVSGTGAGAGGGADAAGTAGKSGIPPKTEPDLPVIKGAGGG